MPISHISLPTGLKHFKLMRDFYVAALAPLGYTVYMEQDTFLGLKNAAGTPDFWLRSADVEIELPTGITAVEKNRGKAHVCFVADSVEIVDQWYESAVKAGGLDNGGPGERPYVRGYYAAYVIDPLGNNIEAAYWPKP